jgi:hypothetical protein
MDYKDSINKYIEQQKQDLIQKCVKRGVKEQDIITYLTDTPVPDYDLDNILIRLINDKVLTVENGYLNP